jgi:hypothetical protein
MPTASETLTQYETPPATLPTLYLMPPLADNVGLEVEEHGTEKGSEEVAGS